MIAGFGIDLQMISSIEKAYQRKQKFATKILTPLEFQKFNSLKGNRKKYISLLSGNRERL